VIQDELHLISGPLGTMAGLYEAAIEALCVREIDGRAVRPKIVASTATVRRAQDQIQALFARSLTQVFPPPGLERSDSFFAKTVPCRRRRQALSRIAAQGRNPKSSCECGSPMGAAALLPRCRWHRTSRTPLIDMTVLGYFNSQELGGPPDLEEEVRIQSRPTVSASASAKSRTVQDRKNFRGGRTYLASSTDKVAEAPTTRGAIP
jgi:hypothetical protein